MLISIQADYRENTSGIPQLLAGSADVSLLVSTLSAGGYIINGITEVERKPLYAVSRLRASYVFPGLCPAKMITI